MKRIIRNQQLVLLSLLALLVLNFPLTGIAARHKSIAGIPALYLYLFIIWLLLVVAIYHIADKNNQHPDE